MRSKFFALIALLVVAGARAEDVDLEKAVRSLIAAEQAYAKLAGEKGFREASISVFADDAVIFAPNAVNGKKFWRGSKNDPVISWRPVFASISRNGELGYTTGPWVSRKSRDAEKSDAFGYFITVWHKNKEGVWKVAFDIGSDNPPPQEVEEEIRTYVPDSAIPHSESANTNLDKALRSFAESLKEDEADAIIDNASDNIRVYRTGQIPTVGKKAAEKMFAQEDAKTTRAPIGTGVAHPVDLAYEYGEYTSKRTKIGEHGIYLCIWSLESNGVWKIALDFQKSAAEKRP